VEALESLCPPSQLLEDLLAGKWRLAYSSTFARVAAAGTQVFRGPPGAGTPVRLGAVYQRIQPAKQLLDNIVELSLPTPFGSALSLSACLRHSLELRTGATDYGCSIVFTELQLRTRGVKGARPLTLPSPVQALGLQGVLESALPEFKRGGDFGTTFADGDMRVARGGLGELRVFVRAM
jgi:hypothetical protein